MGGQREGWSRWREEGTGCEWYETESQKEELGGGRRIRDAGFLERPRREAKNETKRENTRDEKGRKWRK
jgi:hypothetical protein